MSAEELIESALDGFDGCHLLLQLLRLLSEALQLLSLTLELQILAFVDPLQPSHLIQLLGQMADLLFQLLLGLQLAAHLLMKLVLTLLPNCVEALCYFVRKDIDLSRTRRALCSRDVA